jgi:hypothetical protein
MKEELKMSEELERLLHPAGMGRAPREIPKTCPRCSEHEWIPNNKQPGAYMGALSRTDNKTEICSNCGEDEALKDYFDGGCEPQTAWPVKDRYKIATNN